MLVRDRRVPWCVTHWVPREVMNLTAVGVCWQGNRAQIVLQRMATSAISDRRKIFELFTAMIVGAPDYG